MARIIELLALPSFIVHSFFVVHWGRFLEEKVLILSYFYVGDG
jgi:hypothetical protein